MNDERRFIKYLEEIHPPAVESPNHRESLRRDILQHLERRQNMKFGQRNLKVIYVIIALACVSAIAIASAAYLKWRFVDEQDGVYYFEKAPEVESSVTETADGGERTEERTRIEGVGVQADSQADAENQLTEIEQGTAEPVHQTVKETKKVIQEGGQPDAEMAAQLALIAKLQTDAPFSEAEALDLLNALHIQGDFSGVEALDLIDTLRNDGEYSADGLTITLLSDGVRVSQTQESGAGDETEERREIRMERRVIRSGD